jgi:hypothetical protein
MANYLLFHVNHIIAAAFFKEIIRKKVTKNATLLLTYWRKSKKTSVSEETLVLLVT